jgi:ABC-type histidine transport system ATPase subunit
MGEGQIAEDTTPREMLEAPKSERLKQFLSCVMGGRIGG